MVVDAQERLFPVVDPLGVDHEVRSRAAAAEQGGDAAGRQRLDGVAPAGGRAGGVHGEVEGVFGLGSVVFSGAAQARLPGAERARRFQAPAMRVEGDDLGARVAEQVDQHESQRPAADNQGARLDRRPAPDPEAALKAVDRARQRLRQGRDRGFEPGGAGVHAALREDFGDQQVVGEGAVQVDEVAAEVLAFVPAGVALAAGGAVRDDDGVALAANRAVGGTDHGAGDLVAEGRRQRQHRRVAAAAIDLDVRAAGGRGVDPDQQFAGAGFGHRSFASARRLPGPSKKGLGLVLWNHELA